MVEGERGSYTRFTGAGDRPGADARPGLPEADFVVVGAGDEDDGHVLCSLARRLVGNYRRRHGWRSLSKRVVVGPGTIGTHTCLEQSTIRPRPPSFLSRICPKSPCDLAERFSYVYPKTGLSCTISCINQSAAARQPLNWIVAQRYAQSRTFFVLATSLLMDRADPSKPCTQRIPTKPRYRSLFKPSSSFSSRLLCDADQMLLPLVSVHNGLLPTSWRMTCPTSQYLPSRFSPGL